MLFLITIFFYASHSFASQNPHDSATLKLSATLYSIISPFIRPASSCEPLHRYALHVSEDVQKVLIGRILHHFNNRMFSDDLSQNKENARRYFKEFAHNYNIHPEVTCCILAELNNDDRYPKKIGMSYPKNSLERQTSSESEGVTTVGSYESAYSIMSEHSPRSRIRSVSLDPSIPEDK